METTAVDVTDSVRSHGELLGPNVRRIRKTLDLTQCDLAESMDMGQPAIAGIECGRRGISDHTLVLLSHVLRCSVEDLFRPAA